MPAAAWAARDGNAFLELWHPEGLLDTPLVNRRVKGSELARLMEVQTTAAPDREERTWQPVAFHPHS